MSHDSAFAIPRERRGSRTLIAHLEDRPGALNRVVSLFRRRGFNIDSLTVGTTERPGVSRLTVVVQADDETAQKLAANLYKLVDVLDVEDLTRAPAVARELAFVKVRASPERRSEVLQRHRRGSRLDHRRDDRRAGQARRAHRSAATLRHPRAGAHRRGGDGARDFFHSFP